jgi:hypothetical protein
MTDRNVSKGINASNIAMLKQKRNTNEKNKEEGKKRM